MSIIVPPPPGTCGMNKKVFCAAGLILCLFVHVWVCNVAHIETIYIRLHAKKLKQ